MTGCGGDRLTAAWQRGVRAVMLTLAGAVLQGGYRRMAVLPLGVGPWPSAGQVSRQGVKTSVSTVLATHCLRFIDTSLGIMFIDTSLILRFIDTSMLLRFINTSLVLRFIDTSLRFLLFYFYICIYFHSSVL